MHSVFGIIILAVLIPAGWLIMKPRKRNGEYIALPDDYKQLLNDNVAFTAGWMKRESLILKTGCSISCHRYV